MREFSVPPVAEVAAADNLTGSVLRRAKDTPQAVVMRRAVSPGDGATQWRDITASEFRDEVAALAKGLVAAGIEVGDRVAIMSHTRYEWTLIDYAVWMTGAVPVPVYETSSADQAEWILTDSGARACIAENAGFARTIEALRDRVPTLEHVWQIDAEASDDVVTLRTLTEGGREVSDETISSRAAAAKRSDLATLIYTSGTTGRPKGCELTHENLLSDVRNAFGGSLASVLLTEGASTLLFLPLAHVFARVIEVGFVEGGIVFGHWANQATLLPAFASFKPTFILAVPRVFEKVYSGSEQKAASEGKGAIFGKAAQTAVAYSRALDTSGGPGLSLRLSHGLFDRLVYGKLRAALGGQVTHAVSGGAALNERLCHFFRGVGVTVLEGYGLTETTAGATLNRPERNKIGTVGTPVPGVRVKIADDGEVLIGGATIFPGYWHNEEATKETFTEDGWFRTGDLGALDDEGFLSITGRKKEMIVTAGGKNVAPAVLEDRLRGHVLISQALVVGDSKPYIAALITLDIEALDHWKERHGKAADASIASLREDAELIADLQAAIDDANKAVSRAESIRRFRVLEVDFTQEQGHLSAKMSMRRKVLMTDFAADIEALYS